MIELEGKQAPAFNLKGSDKQTHTLTDYKGKNIVIYFYPKKTTPLDVLKNLVAFAILTKPSVITTPWY